MRFEDAWCIISRSTGQMLSINGVIAWNLPSKAKKAFAKLYRDKKEFEEDLKRYEIKKFKLFED